MNMFSKTNAIDTNKWSAQILTVTPDAAGVLLGGNLGNRALRKRTVDRYADIMRRGEWILTPEPIIISDKGRLLNGQHRLTAVKASGFTVQFFVISNVESDVFHALDRGATRTAADALQLPKRTVESAKSIIECVFPKTRMTDPFIRAVSELIGSVMDDLLEYCPTSTTYFSNASFRAAACLRVLNGGNQEYIFDVYRSLILGHVSALPPIAQGLAGMVMRGKTGRVTGGNGRIEALARAWDVFDESKWDLSRVMLKDPEGKMAEIGRALSKMGVK